MAYQTFRILPFLGRKTDVPMDDPSLFKAIAEGVSVTHDVGGVNFDLARKRNCCVKSYGYSEWSNTANAQATKCLGLFELYDGTNRDHVFFDNGKVFVFNGSLNPVDVSGAVTFATGDAALYCPIRVGSYMVFADKGTTTPYKWKNGDAAVTKLIDPGGASGYTEFKFRYLEYFIRRIIGFYSGQTNGNIDMRYTAALPDLSGNVEFPAANQLYVPNDDPIHGPAKMGQDRCFVYCENSINQLIYYPDYLAPFRIYTVVADQGAENYHSIINLGDKHLFFNRNYGFCEYDGGRQITPISQDIEADLQNIESNYYDRIVGIYRPLHRQVVWSVPMAGEVANNRLLFYDIDTKQFTWEDKAMRFIASWRIYDSFTWNDLITELGGTGAKWSDAGSHTWAYYTSLRQRFVYANTDGKLYYHTGEGLDGSNLDGYRIEPIMDFGDRTRRDLLAEIWFDIVEDGAFSIDVHHRSGSTVGEVEDATWTALDSVSCDNPEYPVVRCNKNDKLHQIKWGTDALSEKWSVNGITFHYAPEGKF